MRQSRKLYLVGGTLRGLTGISTDSARGSLWRANTLVLSRLAVEKLAMSDLTTRAPSTHYVNGRLTTTLLCYSLRGLSSRDTLLTPLGTPDLRRYGKGV